MNRTARLSISLITAALLTHLWWLYSDHGLCQTTADGYDYKTVPCDRFGWGVVAIIFTTLVITALRIMAVIIPNRSN